MNTKWLNIHAYDNSFVFRKETKLTEMKTSLIIVYFLNQKFYLMTCAHNLFRNWDHLVLASNHNMTMARTVCKVEFLLAGPNLHVHYRIHAQMCAFVLSERYVFSCDACIDF